MRLTPSQIAIHLICGRPVRMGLNNPFQQRIEEGRRMLVQITRVDFAYDLQAWHDHLKESRQGGYTYGRNIKLPKIMQAALASNEWKNAVEALLESEKVMPENQKKPAAGID